MKEKHSKYIIVGAGLSGLTTAYRLLQSGEEDFTILEARSRVGGRIHTQDGVDMGATWFQEQHSQVQELIRYFEIDKFPQYQAGKSVLVYNSMAPAHYFESDTSGAVANRLAGGSIQLIEALSKSLHHKIQLNVALNSIEDCGTQVVLQTEKGEFTAEKLIVTIPPKLASGLEYKPPLPASLLAAMKQTHTWMSNAIKLGLRYDRPFWREQQLSGTIIGQIGPVIELYDHSAADNNSFALMGFVNEALRDVSPEARKKKILDYLVKYLGPEALEYTDYLEKDWSQDPHTSCKNLKSVYMSPSYGNPAFKSFYMDNKLLFSGTETSSQFGGYLEGAVCSGENAAQMLMNATEIHHPI